MNRWEIVISSHRGEPRAQLRPTGKLPRLKSMAAALLLAAVTTGILFTAVVLGTIIALLIITVTVIVFAFFIVRSFVRRSQP